MANKRLIALEAFMSRKKVETEKISGNVSDYFGSNVFGCDCLDRTIRYIFLFFFVRR